MTRKIFSFITALIMSTLILMPSLVGCSAREDVLKIFNAGEYIDEDMCDDFVEWYYEETGKRIRVQYDTFSTNEEMYTKVTKKKMDYDLVCPSDYMLDKMIKNGLVLPIDKDIVYDGKQAMDVINPKLLEIMETFDPGNIYGVPYMWGTFGIMYDVRNLTQSQISKMNSWGAMFDPELKGKIFMKDSVRDIFVVARLYKEREALRAASNNFTDYTTEEYHALLDDIFCNTSDDVIASVKKTLSVQRSILYKYESDSGKEDMKRGDTPAALGLFWSCDSGYVMCEYDDDENRLFDPNLWYSLPEEGSNVWVDAFAISKYAGNIDAANYFLKFINMTDNAYRNMDYVGSPTAVQEAFDSYKDDLMEDEAFQAMSEEYRDMYIAMMFPSDEDLERCGIMTDFGDEAGSKITRMWIEVKAG